MRLSNPKSFANGDVVARQAILSMAGVSFREHVAGSCRAGARLGGLLAFDAPGGHDLLAIVLHDEAGRISLVQTRIPAGRGYPAISAAIPAAQAHERALWEDHGIHPDGHPWLKPLRRHAALEPHGSDRSPEHPFFTVAGPGVHEVAVGPVHAGIIEPGHFRFQCSGETVHSLEIHLGYQHRGVEALLRTAPPARRLAVAESIAGDTCIGHALAFCMTVEALGGATVPPRALALRAIALELERLANHVGDLGALCNDVGFLPGASWFGRLRGEFLNGLMELSGSRLGRGLLRPGGVRFGLSAARRDVLQARLKVAGAQVEEVAALTFEAVSVLSRFERTGIVERALADDLGLTGPAARASGCNRDIRRDHAHGAYRDAPLPVPVICEGDVMARARIRWMEIRASLEFVRARLAELADDGPLLVDVPAAAPGALTVALVEGWRGEILHAAATDADGRLAAYGVVDPSLRNWFGLVMAMRGNQISDFPLCNKSFNLSYAGHDL